MNSLLSELVPSPARRGAISLSLAGLFALIAVGCGSTSDDAGAPLDAGITGAADAAVAADFRVRSELVFRTRVDLAFEVPGEVGAVNVSLGDRVSSGEVLATVDAETLNGRRHAKAQAKFRVEQTQDELDRVMGLQSEDPLVRAKAQSDLAKAELALEIAQDALDDFQLEHKVALVAARKAVADAEFTVEESEEAVTDFAESHGRAFAAALADRSAARIELDRAREAVTEFLPLYDESLAALQGRIATTENRLDSARTVVRDFDVAHANRLAEARRQLAEAEVNLENARGTLSEFHVKIAEGQFHSLGDGRNFDVVQLNALQAAVAAGERNVEFWEREIVDLEVGPKPVDRSSALGDVERLELELDRLNRELQKETAGPDQHELARLKANVVVAEQALDRAERDLADAERGVDQLKLAQLEAASNSAELALESAQAKLDKLEEGVDQIVLTDMQQSVVAAREARDELAAGPDLAAVELARANLDAAKVDYAEIQKDLVKAELRAPFSGLVKVVTIEPGDIITVGALVISVVDPHDISVLGMVETNHIERIEIGTPASVALGSLRGVTFDAEVQEISSSRQHRTRSHQLPGHFQPGNTSGRFSAGQPWVGHHHDIPCNGRAVWTQEKIDDGS